MLKYNLSLPYRIITFFLACLTMSSCGAFSVKNPPREFSQYPLLSVNTKDLRYPSDNGFINFKNHVLTSLDNTELRGFPELTNKNSIIYDKTKKSIVKAFDYSIGAKSVLKIDNYALNAHGNKLTLIDMGNGNEKNISLGFLKSEHADSVFNKSFLYKNKAYVFFDNAVIIYLADDLLNAANPKPLWFLETDLDNAVLDENTGDLFYSSRVQYSGNVYADAFITRLDYNGKEVSKFKVLTNLLVPDAYLSLAIKDNYLYAAGGGKLQLKKYDFQNHLIWEAPEYICPGGSAHIPISLIRYNDTVLIMPFGDTCFSAWDTETGKMRWSFQSPNKLSFVNTPLLHNNVLYAGNGYLWALDFDTGNILAVSERNKGTQGEAGTPQYDVDSNQIIFWGLELQFYKPLK
jgi:hypothetical protein